jgi:stage II sporulation protein AA (anti-sigma F factor antagonist)
VPVKIINNGDKIFAVLSGEIDHDSLSSIRTIIDAEIENSVPSLLVLDFGAVSFMDSSGIGLILGRMRLLNSMGAQIAVTGASGYPEKIIRLAGLSRLISNKFSEVPGETART